MQTRPFTSGAPLIRRDALALLAASAWPALSHAADLEGLLRAGGCVLLLRHALTQPGVGDPPNFQLEVCSTQRNLSEEGRAQSRRTGAWFSRRALQPRTVLSSAWCRCRDTADLAFGRHQVWPALNSTFGDRLQQSDQTAVLREALARLPQGQFEVWVTHQVNMSALAGDYPGMGEGFVLDRQGKLMGRSRFE